MLKSHMLLSKIFTPLIHYKLHDSCSYAIILMLNNIACCSMTNHIRLKKSVVCTNIFMHTRKQKNVI